MPTTTTAVPQRPRRPQRVPRGARLALRLAALVALGLVVALVYRAVNVAHNSFDLRIYLSAMRWWRAGHPLYDFSQPDRVQGSLGYTYPPFAGLLMRPLAWLGTGGTIVLFGVGNVLALAVSSYWLVGRLASRHGWPRWWVAAALTLLALPLAPVRETFAFGQINLFLVVLVVADLLLAVPAGSRWSGVGVGLATAVKLTPGIFIVYLLVCRRWRAAATAAGTAALATLLTLALFPRDSWQFWTAALWDTDRVGHLERVANQSLLGALSRAFFPDEPLPGLWPVLVVVTLAYGLWRAGQAGRAGDHLAGLTLAGAVGALVSPVSWSHHLYWFVPALVVLAEVALADREPPGRRVGAAILAVATYLTVTIGVPDRYDGLAWPPKWAANPLTQLGASWYVLLLLVLVVALPVRRWPRGYDRADNGTSTVIERLRGAR